MRTFRNLLRYQFILIILCNICVERTVNTADCKDEFTWMCDSGDQCIDSIDRCDGTPNCRDGSDETVGNCIQKNNKCNKYSFRCTYGACIQSDLSCNGQKDCADGSDELPALCQKDAWAKELQGNCSTLDMQCRQSGECVSLDDICDGKPECKDNSDETLEVCSIYPCPTVSFRCGYGGCVFGNAVCNGVAECFDGSDESPSMCDTEPSHTPGTAVANLCRIPMDRRYLIVKNALNGVSILKGGSVQENSVLEFACDPGYTLLGVRSMMCKKGGIWSSIFPSCTDATVSLVPTRPVINTSVNTCRIPDNKGYLKIEDAVTGENIALGAIVPANRPLTFSCEQGYVLKGYNNTVCRKDGQWKNDLPGCYKYCSDKYPISGFSTTATFELNGAIIQKTSFEPGTIAKISCAYFYTRPPFFINELICKERGWHQQKFACIMRCGEPADPVTIFSKGGINTNITEVPWHVGIYENTGNSFENICGGTLISPRFVVSAAHCFFTTKRITTITYDWSKYSIAAGKYYRQYDRVEQFKVEQRNIVNVMTLDDYKGAENGYYRDISLIKLDRHMVFSDTIRPACLYLPEEAAQYVPSDQSGRISAWSQINDRGRESTLQTLHMSTVEHRKCNETLNQNMHINLKGDKFCLASYGGQSFACKGDSGSGFVVRQSDGTFALWGIVSYTPTRTQECSRDNLLVMTNALVYKNWLQDERQRDLEDDIKHEEIVN